MKKSLILASLIYSLLWGAQEPIYSVSSTQFLQNQSTSKKETEVLVPKDGLSRAIGAKTTSTDPRGEVMIITPEARAKDILSAFQYLKKVSAGSKFAIKLNSGSLIGNINDIEVMPAGTMVILNVSTLKGLQYRIEKIENIDTITYD